MDEYKHVMDEIEQKLELALNKLEIGGLNADDISIIRWACNKSKTQSNKESNHATRTI
jgi:hypothetical protein